MRLKINFFEYRSCVQWNVGSKHRLWMDAFWHGDYQFLIRAIALSFA